jgi:hypothetical protein
LGRGAAAPWCPEVPAAPGGGPEDFPGAVLLGTEGMAAGTAEGRTEPDDVSAGRADGRVGRAAGIAGEGRTLGASGELEEGMDADLEAVDEWGEVASAAGVSDPFELFEKPTIL